MIFFLQSIMQRTFQNMRGNLFPSLVTIGIIVVSMLIFSTFSLLAFNLTNFLKIWEDKIEVVAYLKRGTPSSEVESLLKKTRLLEGVEKVNYVSPYDAMAFMETKLGGQKDLLGGIRPTVLPSSLEIQLKKDFRNSTKIKEVVTQLKEIPQFEEVQVLLSELPTCKTATKLQVNDHKDYMNTHLVQNSNKVMRKTIFSLRQKESRPVPSMTTIEH